MFSFVKKSAAYEVPNNFHAMLVKSLMLMVHMYMNPVCGSTLYSSGTAFLYYYVVLEIRCGFSQLNFAGSSKMNILNTNQCYLHMNIRISISFGNKDV